MTSTEGQPSTVFAAQVFAAFAEYLRAIGQEEAGDKFVAQYQQYVAQALADQLRTEDVLKQQPPRGLATEALASRTETTVAANTQSPAPAPSMRIAKRIYDNEPGVLEKVYVRLLERAARQEQDR